MIRVPVHGFRRFGITAYGTRNPSPGLPRSKSASLHTASQEETGVQWAAHWIIQEAVSIAPAKPTMLGVTDAASMRQTREVLVL